MFLIFHCFEHAQKSFNLVIPIIYLRIEMVVWNLSNKEWAKALLEKTTPEWLASKVAKGAILPWSKNLLENTENLERVLDLGSGTGYLSAFLAYNGRRLTLLDFSQENLDFSSKVFQIMGLQGTFIKSDMKKSLPFEDNSFDTVFSVGVLEYFSNQEIDCVIKEAFRVSRKRVIIIVPNALSIFYRIGRWYSKVTHKWEWGGERPFYSLNSQFKSINNINFLEFTVGTKQSLEFLTIFKGLIKNILLRFLNLKDDSRPSRFRQGFVLIAIGKKIK